jgi:hypothetical protein
MCSAGPKCRGAAISQQWKNLNCSPRISGFGFGRFAMAERLGNSPDDRAKPEMMYL